MGKKQRKKSVNVFCITLFAHFSALNSLIGENPTQL